MIRFHSIRSHLTLALGACGMAVALASVPAADIRQGDLKLSPTDIASRKIYFEILTCPSDDTARSGTPLTYVICTGTGLRSDAPTQQQQPAPIDYVVFPVESPAETQ